MLTVDNQSVRLYFVIEDDPPFMLLSGVPVVPIESNQARIDKPAQNGLFCFAVLEG